MRLPIEYGIIPPLVCLRMLPAAFRFLSNGHAYNHLYDFYRWGTPLALIANGTKPQGLTKEETVSRILLLRWSIVALLILLPARNMDAQVSGTIQARATVVASMTVTGSNDLDFGTVTPGVDKSVEKIAVGSAGEWTVVAGGSGAEVTLDFTLPNSLSAGASSLSIIFSNSDASYANSALASQTSPSVSMNPSLVTTANLSSTGAMTVWLGGSVSPIMSQSAGEYTASIQLTVTLTGS